MSKAAVMNILALVGAEARVTIPGVHKQNLAAERTIQEVRQAIKKKCDKHPKEWKSFLKFRCNQEWGVDTETTREWHLL